VWTTKGGPRSCKALVTLGSTQNPSDAMFVEGRNAVRPGFFETIGIADNRYFLFDCGTTR